MKRYLFAVLTLSFLLLALTGCGPQVKKVEEKPLDLTNETVGSLASLVRFSAIPVRGYGLVAGLAGTGSSECPPELREEMERYIATRMPKTKGFSARRFLNSPNTAVVEIIGTIPPMAEPGETFDVRLIPFSPSNTVSLDGGYLYTAELKEMSRFIRFDQYTKTVAEAHGQVFRAPMADPDQAPAWYLLGGGIVKTEIKNSLAIRNPDFRTANLLRNRINERFRPDTARAVSNAEIRIQIPKEYQHNRLRFLEMILSLPMSEDFSGQSLRIESLIRDLQQQSDKYPAELALEAIGKPVLDALEPLLKSPDAATRFHAARCMLYIGDRRGFAAVSEVARDLQSRYRLEAIEAFAAVSNRKQVENVLTLLLADSDINVRLAACDQLLRIGSPAVKRIVVADSFVVDQVFCAGDKAVYVSRKEVPRIVLFGSPIRTVDNLFAQSDDGSIILNAKPEDRYISVSRKHPLRPRVIGPVLSGRELSSLIRTLGEQSEIEDRAVQPGLAIPYTEIAALLDKMCRGQVVDARFFVGPMTQAGK